ncbi:MAG: hypothetical protein IPK13_25435 [Deltaproteobacteria bacterium]|nr:hypothetical protein [Deltaproteobacteria bacterium]
MTSFAVASILFALAAVAPSAEGERVAPSEPQLVEVEGTLRSMRGPLNDTSVLMRVERSAPTTAPNLTLHGDRQDLEVELRRLAGARVRVVGMQNDPRRPSPEHVYVERYEILDVGHNEVPRIGHLATLDLDGKARLLFVDERGLAQLLPEGWAKKLRNHAGAKIWLLGTTIEGRLIPKKFAILKPPRPDHAPDAEPERKRMDKDPGK